MRTRIRYCKKLEAFHTKQSWSTKYCDIILEAVASLMAHDIRQSRYALLARGLWETVILCSWQFHSQTLGATKKWKTTTYTSIKVNNSLLLPRLKIVCEVVFPYFVALSIGSWIALNVHRLVCIVLSSLIMLCSTDRERYIMPLMFSRLRSVLYYKTDWQTETSWKNMDWN